MSLVSATDMVLYKKTLSFFLPNLAVLSSYPRILVQLSRCILICTESKWTLYAGKNAPGLTQRGKANDYTEETCKNACTYDQTCTRVDYNKLDVTCFWGTSVIAPSLWNNSVVNHWELARCRATCVTEWKSTVGYHALGFIPYGSAAQYTEAECKAGCLANSTCFSVDYNLQDKTCWFGFERNPALKEAPAINHWDLRRCVVNNSTDPGTNSTEDCESIWTEYPGIHSQNGVRIPQITQLHECMIACANISSCCGFDVNFADPKNIGCWLHFNTDDFLKIYGDDKVSQYRIHRCPSAMAMCEPSFTQTQTNRYSSGGVSVPSSTTLTACKYACQRDSQSSCRGVDYYSDENRCFTLTSDTFGKNLQTRTGSNEYAMASACQQMCRPAWARFENTAGQGAQPVHLDLVGAPEVDTRICLDFCWRYESCVGVEFITGAQTPCSYYTISQYNDMTNQETKASTVQYQLTDRCSRKCEVSFVKQESTRYTILNSKVISSATSVQQCADHCRLTYECNVYQISKSGTFVCTVGTNAVPYTDVSDGQVDTFVLQQGICANASEPLPPTTTISTPVDQCVANWTLRAGRNALGLNQRGAAKEFTESTCKEACYKNSTCNCIDFNFDDLTCWHGTQINPGTRTDAKINHWDLVRVCLNKCAVTWTLTAGMHGLGLDRQGDNGQFQEESCKTACEAQSRCFGIDYNRQDLSCWFSYQPKPALRTETQINHWEITRTNC